MSDLDYDLVEQYLERAKKDEQYQKDKENRPKYINFPEPGIYSVRLIFLGNAEENLPFKAYSKHSYYEPKQKTNYKYRDTLCWKYVVEQEQLVRYLAERGRIDRQDLQQYELGGCPFCNTYTALLNSGVPKTDLTRLKRENRYLFNVYLNGRELKDGTTDDSISGFFVWEVGQSKLEEIMEPYKRNKLKGIDMMDLAKGYNLIVKATGTGLGRRYSTNWDQSPTPFAKELKTFDFKDLLVVKYLPYQEGINKIKEEYNVALIKAGYSIPGDLNTEKIVDKIFPTKGKEEEDKIPF